MIKCESPFKGLRGAGGFPGQLIEGDKDSVGGFFPCESLYDFRGRGSRLRRFHQMHDGVCDSIRMMGDKVSRIVEELFKNGNIAGQDGFSQCKSFEDGKPETFVF